MIIVDHSHIRVEHKNPIMCCVHMGKASYYKKKDKTQQTTGGVSCQL